MTTKLNAKKFGVSLDKNELIFFCKDINLEVKMKWQNSSGHILNFTYVYDSIFFYIEIYYLYKIFRIF